MEGRVNQGFLPSQTSSLAPGQWCLGPFTHLAGGLLLLGAEILGHLPAAGGEVEDGGGRHMRSLSVVGVVEACGGR